MSDNKQMSFGSFIAGAIVGGLIGAGVAILNAPQSGERTRRQLRATAEEYQGKAQEALERAREHGQTAVSKISDHAQNIQEEARQAVDAAVEEGKAAVKETRKIARRGMKEAEVKSAIREVDDALSK